MKNLFPLIIAITLITGCSKDDISSKSILISAGFACGWGSGQDSLIISRSSIIYKYWIPAQSNEPKITGTRDLSGPELDSIMDSFNHDEFQKLNYNTCNICADGCDEWIILYSNQGTHKIRFSKGQIISSIAALQDKLAEIRSEFSR